MNLGDFPHTLEEDRQALEDLKRAVGHLMTPSVTIQITNVLGTPVEYAVKKLPKKAQERIGNAVNAALHKALKAGIWGMSDEQADAAMKGHMAAVAIAGALGGFGGPVTTFVELPITTTLMMRSIADIARSEGFRPSEFHTQLHCIEVFGLQGINEKDADTGYFAVRAAMAPFFEQVSKELTDIITKKGTEEAGKHAAETLSPSLARWLAELIDKIATRYGITISEKIAAQMVPIVGAAAGATLNALFMDYYQDMARGHFILKRLELTYGEEAVKASAKKYAASGA